MSLPRAFTGGIRPDPKHGLNEPFVRGLKAAGYSVQHYLPSGQPGPGDVLVVWNRYADKEQCADIWERAGGTVLVAENGYCGRDAQGRQHYALAVHGHNGSGTWRCAGSERWASLGLEIKPWRAKGEHVLVAPNRSFGTRKLAMPVGWEQQTVTALRRVTKRPIRVRPHPGNDVPKVPLAEDLVNAHAVVIWASSVGVHALLAGVPVIATSPYWICREAAGMSVAEIEKPPMPERRPSFEKLAWAQWTWDELVSGMPFRWLLQQERAAA